MNPADAGKVIEEIKTLAPFNPKYWTPLSIAEEVAQTRATALTLARDWLTVGEWLEKQETGYALVVRPSDCFILDHDDFQVVRAPTIHELAAKLKESP